jgi:hypothetical protein
VVWLGGSAVRCANYPESWKRESEPVNVCGSFMAMSDGLTRRLYEQRQDRDSQGEVCMCKGWCEKS